MARAVDILIVDDGAVDADITALALQYLAHDAAALPAPSTPTARSRISKYPSGTGRQSVIGDVEACWSCGA
jgi:hypothetical protein